MKAKPVENRLSKFLSTAGVASRRAAGDLVKAGRVSVNGRTETNPGCRVSECDTVELDGKPVHPGGELCYLMLNKPRGYVCTNSDPHAKYKAIDLIKFDHMPRLFSAGRLDKDSEGLILFSNDGEFVEQLTHPRHEILKNYLVWLPRELTPEELQKIRSGVEDEGELLKVRSITARGENRYEIVLNEGRKREIRRITAAVDAPTLRLRRFRVGKLELGALPPGKFRMLSHEEVSLALYSADGASGDSAAAASASSDNI